MDRLVPESFAGTVFRFDHYPRHPDLHRHAEWELNLVIRGSSRIVVGDKRYRIRPNEAVWLYPDQTHTLYEESDDFSMWVALFSPESLERWCRNRQTASLLHCRDDFAPVRTLAPETAGKLFRWCAVLLAHQDDPDYYNASLHHFLMETWRGFQRADSRQGGENFHPAVSRMVELLVDTTNTESVAGLCARAGLSRSSLSKRFKDEVGVDISTFRNRARIKRFLTLYGQGRSRNLLNCAYEAGFGSYTQFYRVFSQHFNQGPRAFMQSYGQDDKTQRLIKEQRQTGANRE